MTIHFAGIALIMLGGGIAAFFAGGLMAMTFDVSDWLPSVGELLAVCGAISAVLGGGIQAGAWAGIS